MHIFNIVCQGAHNIIAELVLDRLLNGYMLLSLRANMDMLDSIGPKIVKRLGDLEMADKLRELLGW